MVYYLKQIKTFFTSRAFVVSFLDYNRAVRNRVNAAVKKPSFGVEKIQSFFSNQNSFNVVVV